MFCPCFCWFPPCVLHIRLILRSVPWSSPLPRWDTLNAENKFHYLVLCMIDVTNKASSLMHPTMWAHMFHQIFYFILFYFLHFFGVFIKFLHLSCVRNLRFYKLFELTQKIHTLNG